MLCYNNPITFHSPEITCNFHTWEYGRMLFTQFDSEYIVNFFFSISGPILSYFSISKLKTISLSACRLASQTTLFSSLGIDLNEEDTSRRKV